MASSHPDGRLAPEGGFFEYFPARIAAPHDDYWNIVIDLGGGRATIRHNLSFIGN
ncbi:DUF1883 domain-containing protein [Ferruginibacter lapsinanis]|uniref:DUF1883 domain-containing protein n=1 Tax=Ferruginibacter lapsinanis TaxID=563172 RepID=UPI001E597943|nr:DUF1883 domain-containing protein [Ferruginibacter lapsinanis]UEG49622.1 DUF1883 domain-containing protein [Ferruginibacter lapsinanis]